MLLCWHYQLLILKRQFKIRFLKKSTFILCTAGESYQDFKHIALKDFMLLPQVQVQAINIWFIWITSAFNWLRINSKFKLYFIIILSNHTLYLENGSNRMLCSILHYHIIKVNDHFHFYKYRVFIFFLLDGTPNCIFHCEKRYNYSIKSTIKPKNKQRQYHHNVK